MPILPTPSTSHIDLSRIYEPAEDSFLLLDTLSSPSEIDFLVEKFSHSPDVEVKNSARLAPLILEVGTGSGVVLAFITAHVQRILGRVDVLTLGIDINKFACAATEQTVLQACRETSSTAGDRHSGHGLLLTCLNADLTDCMRHSIIDILIFNPPYVPTAELPRLHNNHDNASVSESNQSDEDSQLLSVAYAGGKDGMEVTDRLLDKLPSILNKERGVAYILFCKQNKPDLTKQRLEEWGKGWSVEVIGQSGKTGGWEKLQIMRICRT